MVKKPRGSQRRQRSVTAVVEESSGDAAASGASGLVDVGVAARKPKPKAKPTAKPKAKPKARGRYIPRRLVYSKRCTSFQDDWYIPKLVYGENALVRHVHGNLRGWLAEFCYDIKSIIRMLRRSVRDKERYPVRGNPVIQHDDVDRIQTYLKNIERRPVQLRRGVKRTMRRIG